MAKVKRITRRRRQQRKTKTSRRRRVQTRRVKRGGDELIDKQLVECDDSINNLLTVIKEASDTCNKDGNDYFCESEKELQQQLDELGKSCKKTSSDLKIMKFILGISKDKIEFDQGDLEYLIKTYNELVVKCNNEKNPTRKQDCVTKKADISAIIDNLEDQQKKQQEQQTL